MRILVVANIPPYVTGGAETQARLLAERFADRGHTVVIAGHDVENGSIEYRGNTITVHRLPVAGFNRATRALGYIFSLSTFIYRNRRNFDIAYCRFVREAALTISALKSLTPLKVKLVPCTACAGNMGDANFVRTLPFSKTVISMLASQCDAINNISPATRSEFLELGINEDRLTLIPNGIRLADWQPKTGFQQERSFVYLGRLTEQKGLHYLLQALGRLIEEDIQCRLQLIGDGPQRSDLERMVSDMGLDSHVTFSGQIDNRAVLEALSHHDIMVMPSLYEGFCTAVIEAMYAGLPVIVTRSGGPEFFVDETVGRQCDTASTGQLTDHMRELATLPESELRALGQAAHERVLDRFDIEKVSDGYLELFSELLTGRSSQ